MRSLVYEAGLIYLPKIKNRAGNITPVQNNKLPFDVKRVFYLYDIPGGESRGGHAHRARLQQHLNEDGIQTLIHYPIPPHLQQAYSIWGCSKGNFPITEKMAHSFLSLPLWPGIPPEALKKICNVVNSFE